VPATLDNVSTSNAYPAAGGGVGAQLQMVWNAKGGFVSILNNDAYCEVQYSVDSGSGQGQPEWTEELHLPIGTMALPAGAVGIRFRSYVAGSPALVTAVIFAGPEPVLQIGSGGQLQSITVSGVILNEVALTNIASANTIVWKDSSAVVQEAIFGVDDVVGGHHEFIVQAGSVAQFNQWVLNDVGTFSGSTTIGCSLANKALPTSQNMSYMDNSGLFQATAATATTSALVFAQNADSVARFVVDHNGLISWGPGGAGALDATLARSAASTLTATAQLNVTGTNSGITVINSGSGNYYRGYKNSGDTQPAWAININGQMNIGAGGSTAADVVMQRSAAGLFVQTTGTGIGYGTGAGGTSGHVEHGSHEHDGGHHRRGGGDGQPLGHGRLARLGHGPDHGG
jgi:hypothetical protein